MLNYSLKSKSPIKDPPLPNPGESSQFILDEWWYNRTMPSLIAAGLLAMVATDHWVAHFFPYKMSPWPWSVAFIAATIFAFWRYISGKHELRRRWQGIDGEKVVGQMLEQLRQYGCKVYHDIGEEGFNVDHVVIGPHGVFAIETKAPSKPLKGETVVEFSGDSVTVGGYTPDRDPIAQTKASARHVRDLLRKMTGDEIAVKPVLLYVN